MMVGFGKGWDLRYGGDSGPKGGGNPRKGKVHQAAQKRKVGGGTSLFASKGGGEKSKKRRPERQAKSGGGGSTKRGGGKKLIGTRMGGHTGQGLKGGSPYGKEEKKVQGKEGTKKHRDPTARRVPGGGKTSGWLKTEKIILGGKKKKKKKKKTGGGREVNGSVPWGSVDIWKKSKRRTFTGGGARRSLLGEPGVL